MAMGTLIKAVAFGTRVPEETVAVAARRLRAGKQLRPGKRGRGGAEVTSREAAILLIALASGAQLNQMPQAVKIITRLPLVPTPTGSAVARWPLRDNPQFGKSGEVISGKVKQQVFDRTPFANWEADRTFLEALEKVIDCTVRGDLFPSLTEDDFERKGTDPSKFEYERIFTVQVATPAELKEGPVATIKYGGRQRFTEQYYFGTRVSSFEFQSGNLFQRQAGLAFIGQFGIDVVEAVAEAIREQGRPK